MKKTIGKSRKTTVFINILKLQLKYRGLNGFPINFSGFSRPRDGISCILRILCPNSNLPDSCSGNRSRSPCWFGSISARMFRMNWPCFRRGSGCRGLRGRRVETMRILQHSRSRIRRFRFHGTARHCVPCSCTDLSCSQRSISGLPDPRKNVPCSRICSRCFHRDSIRNQNFHHNSRGCCNRI